VVSVGDEAGKVTVYKIHGLDLGMPNGGGSKGGELSLSLGLSPDQQADRLAAAMNQT
jgi:hypothetical protein